MPIGRRMEPTPLARALAEPLHNILLKAKALVTTTASFDPRTSNRRISIIASDYSTEVFVSTFTNLKVMQGAEAASNFTVNWTVPPLVAMELVRSMLATVGATRSIV